MAVEVLARRRKNLSKRAAHATSIVFLSHIARLPPSPVHLHHFLRAHITPPAFIVAAMVDYHDDDEVMKDDPGSYEDVGETDVELVERDRKARDNYDIKLFMVKSRVMHKPSLDTLYYNQSEAFMSHIPDDL
jgi:hypothetical protein